jgi:hypothetical protein
MNLVDLQNRGFVVIDNFINSSEISNLITDYENILQTVTHGSSIDYPKYHHYNILTSKTPHRLNEHILRLLEQIRYETDLQVDFCESDGDYFDTNLKRYDWHMDHEEYYLYQNAYHNLNFWIPLIKPSTSESGVSVIPCDRWGDAKTLLETRGAASFSPLGNKYTVMRDEDLGGKHLLNLNFDELAETPSLKVGDCLVLRGDIIHRTQEVTTARVAYSTRCFNSQAWISRDRFFSQCSAKTTMINNNPALYQRVINAFEQKEHVQVAEVLL